MSRNDHHESERQGEYHDSRWPFALAALLALVGYALVHLSLDTGAWSRLFDRGEPRRTVATLSKRAGGVRYRERERFLWLDVAGTDARPLSSGDMVFTGADGAAVVTFNDKGSVEVGESSLVVVQLEETSG